MAGFLRPLTRGTTYTRLLHLWLPLLIFSVWMFIDSSKPWVPALVLVPVGLVPVVRMGEGVQARLLLTPGVAEPGISVTPSATWPDRLRTVLWMEVRLVLGVATSMVSVWLPLAAYELGGMAWGHVPADIPVLDRAEPHWAYALLIPLPLVALYGVLVGLGELVTAVARRLLGTSAAERLAALEERTERLLERTRIARELHDSIGHALTVAVVQAGAARTAGDPEFTARALSAIEETGRAALEDLERVLGVLRESERPVSGRPTLADADRLLESARLRRQGRRRGDRSRGDGAGTRLPRGLPHPPGGAHQCAAPRGGRTGAGPCHGGRRHPRAGGAQSAHGPGARSRPGQRAARHTRARGPARRPRAHRTARGRLAGARRTAFAVI